MLVDRWLLDVVLVICMGSKQASSYAFLSLSLSFSLSLGLSGFVTRFGDCDCELERMNEWMDGWMIDCNRNMCVETMLMIVFYDVIVVVAGGGGGARAVFSMPLVSSTARCRA